MSFAHITKRLNHTKKSVNQTKMMWLQLLCPYKTHATRHVHEVFR